MSGFELVESPAENIDPSVAQQPVEDLAGLLEVENEPQQAPAGEQPGPALEPEQLGAESGPVQEQPLVEDSEQGEAAQTYALKVNGEERLVTLNDLKEGFQLKSDYTRKTQDLANREQQLGVRVQEMSQQEEQYGNVLGAMKQRLEAMIPQEPDWAALAQHDSVDYAQKRAAWDQLQTQMKSVEKEQHKLGEQRQERFRQGYQGYMQDQQQKLYAAVPELSDPAKANTFFSTLNQYAMNEYGFTPQEVSSVGDHRFLLMADKARKWDLAQAGVLNKEVPTPHIQTLRPGARQVAEPVANVNFRKARTRLERSGDTRDAADAIEAML
jgi:hypothetical protein